MQQSITANDLRIKGVSILEEKTADDSNVIITVRGKNRFVVVPIEKYSYLRECELEAVLLEAKKDLKEGRVIQETVENHIRRFSPSP